VKVYCYSKKKFGLLCEERGWNDDNPPVDTAVISICCKPEVTENVLGGDDAHWFSREHDNVLNVEFDDITEDSKYISDPGMGFTAYGLDDRTADRIVKFIEGHRGMDFIVHCRAGKSRSQAVVRYIADFYPEHDELNPDNPCMFPNVHTFTKLKAARERMLG